MSKLNSRKLWAWLVWTVLIILCALFVKDAVVLAIPWYGGITAVYIGGQAVIDAIIAQMSKKIDE